MKKLTRDYFQYRMCGDRNGRKGTYTIRLKRNLVVHSKSPPSTRVNVVRAENRRNSSPRIRD